MALPDHFEGEDVIITFQQDTDATITNVEGRVLSWNVGGGAASTEDVFAFGGKTFNFQKPREKFTLSFELMLNNSDFDFVQFGSGSTSASFAGMIGKVVKSTDAPSRWRIIFWFQAASSHVSGTAPIVVPSRSVSIYRMIFTDVKSVTFDKDFSAEDYFKGTLNLEFSAADSDGNANYFEEEGTNVGAATTSSVVLHTLTTTAGNGLLREAKGWPDWTDTTTVAWVGSNTGTTTPTHIYRYTGT